MRGSVIVTYEIGYQNLQYQIENQTTGVYIDLAGIKVKGKFIVI